MEWLEDVLQLPDRFFIIVRWFRPTLYLFGPVYIVTS